MNNVKTESLTWVLLKENENTISRLAIITPIGGLKWANMERFVRRKKSDLLEWEWSLSAAKCFGRLRKCEYGWRNGLVVSPVLLG